MALIESGYYRDAVSWYPKVFVNGTVTDDEIIRDGLKRVAATSKEVLPAGLGEFLKDILEAYSRHKSEAAPDGQKKTTPKTDAMIKQVLDVMAQHGFLERTGAGKSV